MKKNPMARGENKGAERGGGRGSLEGPKGRDLDTLSQGGPGLPAQSFKRKQDKGVRGDGDN